MSCHAIAPLIEVPTTDKGGAALMSSTVASCFVMVLIAKTRRSGYSFGMTEQQLSMMVAPAVAVLFRPLIWNPFLFVLRCSAYVFGYLLGLSKQATRNSIAKHRRER